MSGTDLPPPYCALKEDVTTEQTATEVTTPHSRDDLDVYGVLFKHKDNRIGFVQKVILIKLFQALVVTINFLVIGMGMYPNGLYRMMEDDRDGRTNLTVVSSLIFLAVFVLLHYCDNARFKRPYNFMFLLAYPFSFSFFVGVMTMQYGAYVLAVINAAWVLFTIVLFCLLVYSILALQTKIEFRTCIGLPIAAVVFIVSYGLTAPFIDFDAYGVLYCTLALFALTAYMLYDLQIMMSKDYRMHLSPSDYVKAALIMHIDYRYMIMNLLKKNENHNANDGA